MSNLSVPASLDEITPAWLSDALGCNVTGVEVDDIGTGVGVFGAIGRLRLSGDGPSSVIAKLPTTAEANRAVGMALRLYEREHRFFADLSDAVGLTTPQCHITLADGERFVMILEDLGHLEAGDQLAGLSAERALAIVDAIVPMHARWWGHSDLDSLTWMPTQDDPMFVAGVPPIVSAGVAALDPLVSSLPDGSAELAHRVDASFVDLIHRCAVGPRTLVHGDLRLDNLFFDAAGQPVVIDWQLSLRNRGAYDVVWLVATSMEPDVQNEVLPDLLDHYRTALAGRGVAISSDELALAAAEQSAYLLSGPLSLIGTFDFSEAGDGRAAELTRKWVRRGFNCALRLGALDVV
jgi:hypothetical protein